MLNSYNRIYIFLLLSRMRSFCCVREICKCLCLQFWQLFSQQFYLFCLLLCLVEQLSVYCNLLKLLLCLLVSFSILSDHHFLDFLFLLYCWLKIPFLCLELFVLFLDRLNFIDHFLYFLGEMSNSLLSFFSDFFNLFLQGFYLVFIHLGIFFGKSYLHLFLNFQHLNLLYHRVQLCNEILFLLKV